MASTSNTQKNMCRACLATEGKFQSIFLRNEAIDININLAEMIMEYTSVQITTDDGLPGVICLMCAKKCTELYKFKRKCEETDLTLRRLFCDIIKQSQLDIDMKDEPDDSHLEYIEDNVSYKELPQVNNVKMEPGDVDTLGVEVILSDNSDDSILDSIPLKLLVTKSESKKHKCENCNRRFRQMYHLNRHLKAYCSNGVFTCEPSKKVTAHDFKLSAAEKAKITAKMNLKNKKYKHECSICMKRFMTPSHLNRHVKTHTAVRNHICTKCKKTFMKLEQLNTHMNVHNDIKHHICEICSKGFNHASTLSDHMRTHSGEKPFLCTTCGKGFNQSSNLRQHIQRHTGIKSHLCNECGIGFFSKGKLAVHMRTHTGAKPYICPTCNRGFSRADLLSQHKRTHTGERPYKCDLCPMTFSTNSTLVRHRRVHTGERPHICKFCAKAFSQANDMNKHLKRHKGEKLLICTLTLTDHLLAFQEMAYL